MAHSRSPALNRLVMDVPAWGHAENETKYTRVGHKIPYEHYYVIHMPRTRIL